MKAACNRSLAGYCVAAAFLAGCAGSQATGVTPGLTTQGSASIARASAGRPWMLPGARRSNVLYVSYFYGNEVFAYNYPGGKLVGTLTGIPDAQGMCTAKKLKGKFWVVATGSNQVLEFDHGGTSPLATLNVTAGEPASCAVDPTTGDLAVTMITNDNVVVYKNGSGSPVTYTAPFGPYFSAYDKRGDLFVDGSGQTPLAELPKGGTTFEPISTNQTIIFPGGLQWHGNDLAVGDLDTSTIYQFSITGSSATLTTTTVLTTAGSGDFWIQKKHVIASAGPNVGIWKFPAGGWPQKTISGSFYGSVDVVMSTVK
jgi:hypothetical protein